MNTQTLTLTDIEDAARRIAPRAVRTPTISSPHLNQLTNARVFLKLEMLQQTGSFKFRGAFNRLVQIPESERHRGVVAWSSGNHAQGVALAAQLCSLSATIVMPSDAPATKIQSTRDYGAHIVLFDRQSESREQIAVDIAHTTGAIIVPSYDDVAVMAGQGTVGVELIEQCLTNELDAVLLPCGGGGLTAGVSTVCNDMSPRTQVFTVEPEQFDDHARSFVNGQRETNLSGAYSICDALLAPTPGELTFEINQRTVSEGLTVSEQQVRAAMRFAFETLKLVVEPGGAVALARILADPSRFHGQNVGIVLSGGNVDSQLFAEVLSS